MTVGELKKQLEGVSDEMDVFIFQEEVEFANSLAETAKVVELEFTEETEGITAFVISDQI